MRAAGPLSIVIALMLAVVPRAVCADGDVWFDRAASAIEQTLREPAKRGVGDHLELAITLARLRGTDADKDLLRRAAAKPFPPSIEILPGISSLEPDANQARVQRALGNAAEADAALDRLSAGVQKLPDDMMKTLMTAGLAAEYFNAGHTDTALKIASQPGALGIDHHKFLAFEAYVRNDASGLSIVLNQMKQPNGVGDAETLRKIDRLADAEAAVPTLNRADARQRQWTALATAYDQHGDSAARHRCFSLARKACDEDQYLSAQSLAWFGQSAMRHDEPALAQSALDDAVARRDKSIYSIQAVAILAASLHDPRLASLIKQLDDAWAIELISLNERAQQERTNPTTMPGPGGTIITLNADVAEKQAEHELMLAAIYAARDTADAEMWKHIEASVAVKRMESYDNSDAFSYLCEALSSHQRFETCERVLSELPKTDEDREGGRATMARAAIRAGRWDDAWRFLAHRAEQRRLGLCERVLDHWVSSGDTAKCLASLDGIPSASERAMIALHLGAKAKKLPARDVLDLMQLTEW